MSTIAQDAARVKKFEQFKNDQELLTDIFIHGDAIVKQGNETLTAIKAEIDSGVETAWTKQDFNDMLAMRNAVLAPIMENASFAAEFTPYTL
jgi:hypothetical protein